MPLYLEILAVVTAVEIKNPKMYKLLCLSKICYFKRFPHVLLFPCMDACIKYDLIYERFISKYIL